MIGRILIVSMVILLTALPASAQLDRVFKGLGGGEKSGLSDVKIGSGLKEALQIGTENAVSFTGKTDGYFMNLARQRDREGDDKNGQEQNSKLVFRRDN